MPSTIDERLSAIIRAQHEMDQIHATIEKDYPEVWVMLENAKRIKEKVDLEKTSIRQELAEQQDYDVHQVDGFNISVSRTVKLAVSDPDKVSADYKKTEEVIDLKKAQEDTKVLGIVPAGFEDRSSYRLNWKEIKNV